MRAQHGVGHGVEAKQPSWARRRACPRKRASLIPPSAPRQPKPAPKGQAASSRYALIDKELAQATLASTPIRRTLSQPETKHAPSKRGFSTPLTPVSLDHFTSADCGVNLDDIRTFGPAFSSPMESIGHPSLDHKRDICSSNRCWYQSGSNICSPNADYGCASQYL